MNVTDVALVSFLFITFCDAGYRLIDSVSSLPGLNYTIDVSYA